MGHHKRYIDKQVILSAFKESGAKGVVRLYSSDGIVTPSDSTVCNYINKIMFKNESVQSKEYLIETYMLQLLEGLYEFK